MPYTRLTTEEYRNVRNALVANTGDLFYKYLNDPLDFNLFGYETELEELARQILGDIDHAGLKEIPDSDQVTVDANLKSYAETYLQ